MGDHHNLTGLPGTSIPPQFNYSQPGTSTGGPLYGGKPSHGLEDIPDVEEYERNLLGAGAGFNLLNVGNMANVPDEHTPMMSPVNTTTKILQRSGIKMEIPPYLDPDSQDDDPEDGVNYPDPDLFDTKNTNMTEYDLDVLKLGKPAVDEARKKIEVPDASAPPNKIVEYLMYYRTLKESELIQLNAYRTKRNRLSLNLVKNNIDREFDQKACESLVKKLKDKKNDLQNLIDVVLSKGTKYTGCITIPRTLDGRLQVHGRKGFPHVVYGKLWRFNEMTKNETRHVDHCKHAFEMKSDMVGEALQVCVNPYHYEIVIGTMIVGQRDHDNRDMPPPHQRYHTPGRQDPVDDMSRFIPPASIRPPPMNMHTRPQPMPQQLPSVGATFAHPLPHQAPHNPGVSHPYSIAPQTHYPLNMNPIPQMPQMPQMPPPLHQGYGMNGPSCSSENNNPFHQNHHYNDISHPNHYSYDCGPNLYGFPTPYPDFHHPFNQQPHQPPQLSQNHTSQQGSHQPGHQGQVPNDPPISRPVLQPSTVTLDVFRRYCRQTFGNRFFEGESEQSGAIIRSSNKFIEEFDSPICGVTVVRPRMTDGEVLENIMPEDAPYHDICKFILRLTSESVTFSGEGPEVSDLNEKWGTIVYYEKNLQIGEKKCSRGNFHVDGGFICSENRYSLGLEPNPIREPVAFKVRKAIVDGIRFSYKKDGSVWLQNRMKYPVFVTSGYLDEQSGGLKKDKVHKVYGCASIKTFGFNVSKQIIRDALLSKQMATMYLQGKLTPMNYIYEKKTQEELRREATRTTDSLAKYCCVRVSFCKGFGEAYPERPSIHDCPVWIELKINIAYDFMDSICQYITNCFEPLGMEDFAKLGINVSDD
ncbi:Smad protein daf-3 [Caenorhabditis elegans]|uniref:Isoform b of Smad protein daf-3 n=2 Tax=Caenorhabditis elegans TaxID=6239 RepID=Q95QI7-5|nr:Smad protein daf-3 [Caenorhabditis elegans]CCD69987.1 Smad protein daf-3 [Caenorhabditis elegans]|eukprot:NP_001024604.1 Dwarfin sma [Caenorhabditis elegans]